MGVHEQAQVEGSLRSAGVVTVATDKMTRTNLKILASDCRLSVGHYLRQHAREEVSRRGLAVPFSALEDYVKDTPIPASVEDVKAVRSQLNTLQASIEALKILWAGGEVEQSQWDGIHDSRLSFLTNKGYGRRIRDGRRIRGFWARVRVLLTGRVDEKIIEG